MLFVTTRNKVDSVTALHVLNHDRSTDGGYFVPLQLPKVSPSALEAMAGQSFGQCMANILNLFFNCRLDGWDVDFCIGRQSVRIVPLSQKICIAECWHNPDRDFGRIVRNLSSRIRADKENIQPTYWARMSVTIAILFAVYAQLRRQQILCEGQPMDISVTDDGFSLPMAGWYARRMGLPIGNVICACRDNSRLWDFFRNGVLPTGATSGHPGLVQGLEPLVYSVLGREEALRFSQTVSSGGQFVLQDRKRQLLSNGFRACVIGSHRINSMLHNALTASAYQFDQQCALAYAGLQDTRTSEGENRVTVLLSQKG